MIQKTKLLIDVNLVGLEKELNTIIGNGGEVQHIVNPNGLRWLIVYKEKK